MSDDVLMYTLFAENAQLRAQLGATASLLEQMVNVAENADETGYVTDCGFVDLDKLHAEVRAAIAGDAAAKAMARLGTALEDSARLDFILSLYGNGSFYQWATRHSIDAARQATEQKPISAD